MPMMMTRAWHLSTCINALYMAMSVFAHPQTMMMPSAWPWRGELAVPRSMFHVPCSIIHSPWSMVHGPSSVVRCPSSTVHYP